jgi:hypothetical protein
LATVRGGHQDDIPLPNIQKGYVQPAIRQSCHGQPDQQGNHAGPTNHSRVVVELMVGNWKRGFSSFPSVGRLAAQMPAAMVAYISTSSQKGKVPKSREANGRGAVNSTIQTDQAKGSQTASNHDRGLHRQNEQVG